MRGGRSGRGWGGGRGVRRGGGGLGGGRGGGALAGGGGGGGGGGWGGRGGRGGEGVGGPFFWGGGEGVEAGEAVSATLPEDELMAWERRQQVQVALTELGGQCEKLLRALFFADGEPSYSEIAERLGMAVGSIGPVRGRCLKKLM